MQTRTHILPYRSNISITLQCTNTACRNCPWLTQKRTLCSITNCRQTQSSSETARGFFQGECKWRFRTQVLPDKRGYIFLISFRTFDFNRYNTSHRTTGQKGLPQVSGPGSCSERTAANTTGAVTDLLRRLESLQGWTVSPPLWRPVRELHHLPCASLFLCPAWIYQTATWLCCPFIYNSRRVSSQQWQQGDDTLTELSASCWAPCVPISPKSSSLEVLLKYSSAGQCACHPPKSVLPAKLLGVYSVSSSAHGDV